MLPTLYLRICQQGMLARRLHIFVLKYGLLVVLYEKQGEEKVILQFFSRFQFDFKNQAETRQARHTSRQSQEMASFWSHFQVVWLLISGDMGCLWSIIAHSSIKRKQKFFNDLKILPDPYCDMVIHIVTFAGIPCGIVSTPRCTKKCSFQRRQMLTCSWYYIVYIRSRSI